MRRAVVHFLMVASVGVYLAGVVNAGDVPKSKTLYDSRCAFCHGVSGKGDGPAGAALKPPPTNFTSADTWQRTTREAMKALIENGKPGTAMVAFKASFTSEQIDALVAYLQTFKTKQ